MKGTIKELQLEDHIIRDKRLNVLRVTETDIYYAVELFQVQHLNGRACQSYPLQVNFSSRLFVCFFPFPVLRALPSSKLIQLRSQSIQFPRQNL